MLLVGLGAFFGANARFLLGSWFARRFGPAFPFGTLVINVSGSFAIGAVLALLAHQSNVGSSPRLLFVVGFLGAYTTFSTFSFETLALLESRSYRAAAASIFISLVLGLAAVAAGAALGGPA
jgi:CrcB protein